MSKSKYQPPKEVKPEHQEFFKKIGSRLKAIREGKEISINKLSKELDISRTSIYLIEAGSIYPNTFTIIRIIDYFNIDPIKFFKDF